MSIALKALIPVEQIQSTKKRHRSDRNKNIFTIFHVIVLFVPYNRAKLVRGSAKQIRHGKAVIFGSKNEGSSSRYQCHQRIVPLSTCRLITYRYRFARAAPAPQAA